MNPMDELKVEARVMRREGKSDWADGVEYAVSFLREQGISGVAGDVIPAPPPRTNTRYSDAENSLIRAMWQQGKSIAEIATQTGRQHGAIYKQAIHGLKLPKRVGDTYSAASALPLLSEDSHA